MPTMSCLERKDNARFSKQTKASRFHAKNARRRALAGIKHLKVIKKQRKAFTRQQFHKPEAMY